jgi:DNA invertase Pin-like site-specific DNA recombinase
MVTKHYVSYLRVSATKQGENGLGVKAQREAVRRYLLGHHGEKIAHFVEVRQPAAAMALAKKRKVTLARSALPQRRVHRHVDG